MTKEDAIAGLRKLQTGGDPEAEHSRADKILCELLKSLGHGDVVAEWEKVLRWYA